MRGLWQSNSQPLGRQEEGRKGLSARSGQEGAECSPTMGPGGGVLCRQEWGAGALGPQSQWGQGHPSPGPDTQPRLPRVSPTLRA